MKHLKQLTFTHLKLHFPLCAAAKNFASSENLRISFSISVDQCRPRIRSFTCLLVQRGKPLTRRRDSVISRSKSSEKQSLARCSGTRGIIHDERGRRAELETCLSCRVNFRAGATARFENRVRTSVTNALRSRFGGKRLGAARNRSDEIARGEAAYSRLRRC